MNAFYLESGKKTICELTLTPCLVINNAKKKWSFDLEITIKSFFNDLTALFNCNRAIFHSVSFIFAHILLQDSIFHNIL